MTFCPMGNAIGKMMDVLKISLLFLKAGRFLFYPDFLYVIISQSEFFL